MGPGLPLNQAQSPFSLTGDVYFLNQNVTGTVTMIYYREPVRRTVLSDFERDTLRAKLHAEHVGRSRKLGRAAMPENKARPVRRSLSLDVGKEHQATQLRVHRLRCPTRRSPG